MPRVPTYDEFQATPQVLGPTRVEDNFTPAMGAMPGQQLQAAGQALEKAGDAASKILLDIQKDANEAAAKEADNVAATKISDVLYNAQNGFLTRQGKDALVNQEDARRAIQKELQSAGDGLGNEMQRRLYGDVAHRRMVMALQQIDSHTALQTKVYNTKETDARMTNARRDAENAWQTWGMNANQQLLVQQIETNLTQGERAIVDYHRNSVATGTAGSEGGKPVTVYSKTIEIPDGPNAGKFVTVPGWYDGAKHDDDGQVWEKWKGEINANKWPIYSDPKVADQRAKFIHGIMDLESESGGGPTPYDTSKKTMITSAVAKGRLDGFDENSEYTKALVLGQTTQLHGNVIGNMLVANQSRLARQYYDSNVNEIDPDHRKTISDMLKAADVKDESLRLSMTLKGGVGQQTKALDDMFKNGEISAEVYDATRQRVEHNWEVSKARQAEGEKSIIGSSTDWFVQHPGSSIQDFQQANPGLYNSLKNSGHLSGIVAFSKGNKVETDPAVWAGLMTNTQELKSLTPTEIFNKYSLKVSSHDLDRLYSLNAALNGSKEDQHLAVLTTTEMVKDSAVKLGIIEATGRPSETQATNFNAYQQAIDDKVHAFERSLQQSGKARKATPDELKKILQEVEMDRVYKDRSFLWDKPDVPLITMTADEYKSAYVKVGGEEIYLTSIPANQRALIIPALRAAGMPVTEQNIANYWVRGGKKK